MKKIIFLSIFLLILSCSDTGNYAVSDAMEASPVKEMEMVVEDDNTQNSAQNETIAVEQKLIKTGYFTFETKSMEATYAKVKSWTAVHKGFIQNDKTTKEYDRIRRIVLVRVPSNSFQTIVDSINNSVTSLDRKEVVLDDVTEEFVDLEARLLAKRKLEERYLQLLSKATSVKDMLEIERQIANIREEIESKQGRLKYLQNKVSLSSIYLNFYEMSVTQKAPSQTYAKRLWRAAKGGFEGIGNFFIGVIYIWPFLLIAILGAYFVRRRIRKKRNQIKK